MRIQAAEPCQAMDAFSKNRPLKELVVGCQPARKWGVKNKWFILTVSFIAQTYLKWRFPTHLPRVRRFVVDPGYPFHAFRSFSFSSGVPLFDLFLSPCSSFVGGVSGV